MVNIVDVQVMKTDHGDVSVPITWAYNHHFEAYLSGKYSQMSEVDTSVTYYYDKNVVNSHGATRSDMENVKIFTHIGFWTAKLRVYRTNFCGKK